MLAMMVLRILPGVAYQDGMGSERVLPAGRACKTTARSGVAMICSITGLTRCLGAMARVQMRTCLRHHQNGRDMYVVHAWQRVWRNLQYTSYMLSHLLGGVSPCTRPQVTHIQGAACAQQFSLCNTQRQGHTCNTYTIRALEY